MPFTCQTSFLWEKIVYWRRAQCCKFRISFQNVAKSFQLSISYCRNCSEKNHRYKFTSSIRSDIARFETSHICDFRAPLCACFNVFLWQKLSVWVSRSCLNQLVYCMLCKSSYTKCNFQCRGCKPAKYSGLFIRCCHNFNRFYTSHTGAVQCDQTIETNVYNSYIPEVLSFSQKRKLQVVQLQNRLRTKFRLALDSSVMRTSCKLCCFRIGLCIKSSYTKCNFKRRGCEPL